MIIFQAQEIRFTLDRRAGQLWRGRERVHLPRKEWEVLRYLAESPGKLVSKDELHQTVWGDTHVGPAAIDRAVSDVRRALGDRADDPLFIETVRGRGYRFVAQIESATDPPPSIPGLALRSHPTPADSPVRNGHSAFPTTDKIDIFRVVSFDRWPYESAISYRQAAPNGHLPLNSDLVFGTKYRCHSLLPQQFLNWGLIGQNYLDGEHFEDAAGNHLFSDDVPRPAQLWIQVEYVLFHSTARSDDARIELFRRRITAEGLVAAASLGATAPDHLEVGSFNDPWFQWYQQCDRTPEPECTLYVSAITDLEYVNARSIPGRDDYDNIQVSICDYRPYAEPPTLTKLFAQFDRYNTWFIDVSGRG